MSGLILCRDVEVRHPFYVKEMGINLCSAEELCYYIYNHAFLIEEDFFDEEMLNFIGLELKLPELEKKLRRWKSEDADLVSLLVVVLQDIHYYNEKELAVFRDRMAQMRSAKPWERTKQKADYMLRQKKLESALRLYESLLPAKDEPMEDAVFTGRVYYNQGTAYAQLFSFREAASCFEKAYELLGEEEVLRHLYMLYQLDPTLGIREDLLEQLPAETQYKWKEEFDVMKKRAEFSGKSLDARAALEKNAFRRPAAIDSLAADWKKEYRSLVR